ncbi:T9SS type A sorting domain-containing protein [Cesiribacter sp. SM1]|uniref:VPS10 domain-containing protein n=1 Tax=Cesiribacter sp. SM1 TaxID=2861196 RepID=UPI001CD6D5B4|nr:T9SS type A sorting domain-containing protein [Cesiribacter sp. SM1]
MKMAKFFTLLLAGLFSLILTSHAQFSFEATPELGRLYHITYDNKIENKVYALTNSNQILVSRDNGKTWDILYVFPYSGASISDLKIVPGDKALSFVVSNSKDAPDGNLNGLYLLHLASNRISKQHAAPNLAFDPAIDSYSIFDHTGRHILMHTSFLYDLVLYTQVFYTTNGGKNWKEVYFNENFGRTHINNVAIHPNNPTTLFLARSHGPEDVDGGLLISTDAGNTWNEKLNGIILNPIAFNPANADEIIIGTGITFGIHEEALYRSMDGGETWNKGVVNWSNYITDNTIDIKFDPKDTKTVWVLEENEILKSRDGGATWNSTVFPENSSTYYGGISLSINPYNSSQVFITSDVYPICAQNAGEDFVQVENPFYNVTSLAVADHGSSEVMYYASQGGYLVKNLTSQETKAYNLQPVWTFMNRKYEFAPDPAIPGSVFVFTPGNGFTSAELYYSDDYGATLHPVLTGFASGLQKVVKVPGSSAVYWASLRLGDSSSLYKIDISDKANIYYEEVWITEAPGVISGISFSSTNPKEVFVSKGNTVFKSTDDGVSWEARTTGLESLHPEMDVVWDLAQNPFDEKELIIATSKGLFLSKDGAAHWVPILEGSDAQRVRYSPLIEGQIIAGTHTADGTELRLFYSLDGGAEWTSITTAQLAYTWTSEIDFSFSETGMEVYMATSHLGIVKYPINIAAPSKPKNKPVKPNAAAVLQAEHVNLYPNPASSHIEVDLKDPETEVETIKIYTMTGQPVLETKQDQVDISHLDRGIYLIRTTTSKGDVITQRLIKQ